MSRFPLLATLLALTGLLAAQTALAAKAPPYGYTLKGGSCPSADNGETPSPWEAFSSQDWSQMDEADKSAVLKQYCTSGSAYLSQYMRTKSRLEDAATPNADQSDSQRLTSLQKADTVTKSGVESTCSGQTEEGENSCRFCCRQVVALHGKLINEEGKIADVQQSAQVQTAVQNARALDSRRLAALNLEGSVDQRAAANRRNFDGDDRPAAVTGPESTNNGNVKVGKGETNNDAPLRDQSENRKIEHSTPPPQTTSDKEQAYIDNRRADAMPGLGWAAARGAKDDVESMHGYIQNCYQNNPNSKICQECRSYSTKELQDYEKQSQAICQQELLKRRLGE